jgi:hypothetical protein
VNVGVVVPYHLEVAAEHRVVADIESCNGWVQPDVCFREMFAKDELATSSVSSSKTS